MVSHALMILAPFRKEIKMVRYEKHCHCFRKFGVVEMQNYGVNEQVIRYLMGQKRDTYSNWNNRYDDLLEIYRRARPRLDEYRLGKTHLSLARLEGATSTRSHSQGYRSWFKT
jgi:hypothetical protein